MTNIGTVRASDFLRLAKTGGFPGEILIMEITHVEPDRVIEGLVLDTMTSYRIPGISSIVNGISFTVEALEGGRNVACNTIEVVSKKDAHEHVRSIERTMHATTSWFSGRTANFLRRRPLA